MTKKDVFVAILAGGKGERLWPKSRACSPKQYLGFLGKRTFIQDAFLRTNKITSKNILIVTDKDGSAHIGRQLKKLERRKIVIEPFGRDTAPAVGLATLLAFRKNKNSILVVLPSDHIIGDNKKFLNIINTAVDEARKTEAIITLGIKPMSAESTYGYIGIEKRPTRLSSGRSYKVAKFIEKPRYKLAKRLASSGRFFWNSGIFIFKSSTMLSALKRHAPSLYKGLLSLPKARNSRGFTRKLEGLYRRVKSDSLDCAVLEKSKNIRMITSDFGWSDIGSYNAFAGLVGKDKDGNVVLGSHVGVDTKDSIVLSDVNQLVGTIGLKDLVVVAAQDAVLVSTKKGAGDIKKLVGEIRRNKTFRKFL